MQNLLGSPREDLDPDLLLDALSYRAGGTWERGVRVLGLDDSDTGRELPFVGGEVAYAYRPPLETFGQSSGVTETRTRARFEVVGRLQENLAAVRLAPYTRLRLRDNTWARFDHGVFEPQNPGVSDDGTVVRRSLVCEDKSTRWRSKILGTPTVVPGTAQAVATVQASLTAVFGETRFAITSSSATIGQQMIFEADTTYLDFYSGLLEAVGYDQLVPDERGRPSSQPLSNVASRGAEQVYGAQRGLILTAGTVSPLLPTLPNVLVFSARQGASLGNIEGNGLRTVRNQSTGPASLDARGGYEVVKYIDTNVTTNQATLDAVAAAESARYFAGGGLRFEGHIALNLLAGDRDVVDILLPRLGLTGGTAWNVTSWNLPMDPVKTPQAALMNFTAERRVGV